jgi:uncharacterized protein with GYD domain
MSTFVLLTRLSDDAAATPRQLESLERGLMDHIRNECPGVEWVQSLAVLGPYDYLDVFRAPDVETAATVATLVRAYGRAHTEIWGAVEWDRFKELLHRLPDHALVTEAS